MPGRPHRRERLSAITLQRLAKIPGLHADGGGLALKVRSETSRSWVYRWMLNKVAHEAGLGKYPDVSLKRARELAGQLRAVKAEGRDPVAERKRMAAMTFAACADAFIKSKAVGWSPNQTAQWRASLRDHAASLDDLSVAAIDVPAVLAVLSPIWTTTAETARRVRQRIELILNWAIAHEYRTANNPASKAILNLLPQQTRNIKHLAALPVADIPSFMSQLRKIDSSDARALEFTILTAARTDQAVSAPWSEFDLVSKTWTIPGTRMKARRVHVVPLSAAALACLAPKASGDQRVFTVSESAAMRTLLRRMGYTKAQASVHGFRSTFRDWAQEAGFSNAVSEAALGHALAHNATEGAYLRTTLFEQRRQLMTAWADACAGKAATGENVVALRA